MARLLSPNGEIPWMANSAISSEKGRKNDNGSSIFLGTIAFLMLILP